jgi:hypothetical protein
MNYAAFSYRSSQCLYLSEKFMKLITPIHLLGVALFFSMVSNSHGQDALILSQREHLMIREVPSIRQVSRLAARFFFHSMVERRRA